MPLAGQVMRAGLRDPSKEVRVACCDAWGRRGGAEAVEILGTALTADTDIDVRLAAAPLLGKSVILPRCKLLAVALEERQDPALQYRCGADRSGRLAPKDLGNDLGKWRQYAKNPQVPLPEGPSLAE